MKQILKVGYDLIFSRPFESPTVYKLSGELSLAQPALLD